MVQKKVSVVLAIMALVVIMLCACGSTPVGSSRDEKKSENSQGDIKETEEKSRREEKSQKEEQESIPEEETPKQVGFYDGQRVVYVLFNRWDSDYDDNTLRMVMLYSPEPDGTYTLTVLADTYVMKDLFSLEEGLPSNDEMFDIVNAYMEGWTDLPDRTCYEREGNEEDHPHFRREIIGYENSSTCWRVKEGCEVDPMVVAPMEDTTLERIELGGREYFVAERGKWLMEITDDIKDVEYFQRVRE